MIAYWKKAESCTATYKWLDVHRRLRHMKNTWKIELNGVP